YFIINNIAIYTAQLANNYITNHTKHRVHFFLPYSLFLNVIEEYFSKQKCLVRKQYGLNADELVKHISNCSKQICKDNCKG
ncbi:hypothetical protein F4703DRAFT_1715772, partial [Phycomyces blakesleeanus]